MIHHSRHDDGLVAILRHLEIAQQRGCADGFGAKAVADVADAVVEGLAAVAALDVVEQIQLDGLVFVDQVDGADGEGADGLFPIVALAEERAAGLRELERALRGIGQRGLVLAIGEVLVLDGDLDALCNELALAQAAAHVLRKRVQHAPDHPHGGQGIYHICEGKPEFLILKCEPAESIVFIHNRMPVPLPRLAHHPTKVLRAAALDIKYKPA